MLLGGVRPSDIEDSRSADSGLEVLIAWLFFRDEI
jgi:hypothetical protein